MDSEELAEPLDVLPERCAQVKCHQFRFCRAVTDDALEEVLPKYSVATKFDGNTSHRSTSIGVGCVACVGENLYEVAESGRNSAVSNADGASACKVTYDAFSPTDVGASEGCREFRKYFKITRNIRSSADL